MTEEYRYSDEWYTPPNEVARVRQTLGGIELDPASCAEANKIVGAKRFFTKEDDGLGKSWHARTVFLNPPYGKGGRLVPLWVDKMIQEFTLGHFSEGVILVNSSTETQWFQPLLAYPVAFRAGRIAFLDPGTLEPKNKPRQGSAYFYFGPRWARFASYFVTVGRVMVPLGYAR
jgi:ParB family chromosome partitioning protein